MATNPIEPLNLRYMDGIDPGEEATGIFVRANGQHGWQSVDIINLEYDSLKRWLRSHGEKNNWAEQVVYLLLGVPQEEIEKLADDDEN